MGPAMVIALGLAVGASGLNLKAGYVLCLRDTYDWDSTIAACTAVIESPAATAHMKFRSYGHRALARFHGKQQYSAAIDDISHSIAIEPQNPKGYFVRAQIRYERDDYAEAIPDLKEGLARDPANIDALTELEYAYGHTGQLDLSIAAETELLRLKPNDVQTFMNRGINYQNRKDFDRAREDFAHALALDSGLASEFPAKCFDDDPLWDLATGSHPKLELKNWPACEKAAR